MIHRIVNSKQIILQLVPFGFKILESHCALWEEAVHILQLGAIVLKLKPGSFLYDDKPPYLYRRNFKF